MTKNALQNFDISGFQKELLHWYGENKRDLPWRQDQNPYKVWVSEVMLQQTKVDTVIPYFNHFIKEYPTVYDLAKADTQAVLKTWEGLGYYSRARNLQEAVREVVTDYDGIVPNTAKELQSLKGIGPYTSGAILSIAFDEPEPAVDGNVMRVLSRVLKIEENIAEYRVRKLFESYTKELISKDDPSSFNQGLMELGALVCTPKSPSCLLCPVQAYCRAFDEGIEDQLPIKSKAKKQKEIAYVSLLIKNDAGEIAIEQRPSKGLLADLWQFPMVPIDEIGMNHMKNWLFAEYGIHIDSIEKKGKLKHVFSHLIWNIDIYSALTTEVKLADERIRFVQIDELDHYPFPVSHTNMMKFI